MQPTERLHTLELLLHADDLSRVQCFTLASPRHPALVVLDALRQAGHCHTPEWNGDPRPRVTGAVVRLTLPLRWVRRWTALASAEGLTLADWVSAVLDAYLPAPTAPGAQRLLRLQFSTADYQTLVSAAAHKGHVSLPALVGIALRASGMIPAETPLPETRRRWKPAQINTVERRTVDCLVPLDLVQRYPGYGKLTSIIRRVALVYAETLVSRLPEAPATPEAAEKQISISLTSDDGRELARRAADSGLTPGRYLRRQLSGMGIIAHRGARGPKSARAADWVLLAVTVEEYRRITAITQSARDVGAALTRWAIHGLYSDTPADGVEL